MICPKCSAALPDEARFCPYCMTGFSGDDGLPDKRSNTKLIMIIAVLLILTAAIAAGFVFRRFQNENGRREGSGFSSSDAVEADTVPAASGGNKTERQPESENEEYTDINGNIVESTLITDENGETYPPGIYKWDIDGEGNVTLMEYY